MDNRLLEALDLHSGEIAVYKAVLKTGGIASAALAKTAGVKRTTAYNIARGLVEKGLLIEDTTRRPRIFTPATPAQVLALIRADKKRIADREELLKKVANELSNLSASTSYPVPTVRFVEEAKIMDFLTEQAHVWDRTLTETDSVWWGFQDHTFVEYYGSWIRSYWKKAPKELMVNLLSNRSPVEIKFASEPIERRNIKFWGEATNFISTTWVVGDYVVMINTRTKPFYLVEIHDKLLAHDHREVFKNLLPPL